MPHLLAALLTLLSLFPSVPQPSAQSVQAALESGMWLRLHVVAQDDSAEMQRVKRCVRDAVQDCFQQHKSGDHTCAMYEEAARLLPRLTAAAQTAARAEGFSGPVDITLDVLPFDERDLFGLSIPAGSYPALMIRLGDAQGQNWWGLLDPELSFRLAMAVCPETTAAEPLWDWSWKAFLSALFGVPLETADAAQGGVAP